MSGPDALAEALAHFNELRADLVPDHGGRCALIEGRRLVDVFDTEMAAHLAGVRTIRHAPFLVRRIGRVDVPVQLLAVKAGAIGDWA